MSQPKDIQAPSVVGLQEEMSGMRKLIGELRTEIKSLKGQLEQKYKNETVLNLVRAESNLKKKKHLSVSVDFDLKT